MAQGQQSRAPAHAVDERNLHRKMMRRILPFLFVCYVVSYLDRVNVGFAALTMNAHIGLTATSFGIGAGLFFLGYFLAEIPSNLIMMRVGARLWIARIMITWGLVSAATAFVTGPIQFGIARFLLGLGEAGFVPGVFLYLSFWFPSAVRARATSLFLLGIPVANIVGSPISGALVQIEGFGLVGWQWLLILEALPAVILGIVCLFVLTDRPEKAQWLTPAERDVLVATLAAEKAAIEKKHPMTLAQALRNWRVLTLAAINFCAIIGSLGVGLWLPQMIKQLGLASSVVGVVAAIPYVCGAVAMVVWGRVSDRGGDRTIYPALSLALGAVGLTASTLTPTPGLTIVALCVAVMGINSYTATFWAVPSGFLTGRAAAGGIAMIVSIGNLGGFAGPYLIGVMRELSGGFTAPLLAVGGILLLGALMMLALGRQIRRDTIAVAVPA
ncbi:MULTISPECIES: MFS transporter [Methylobacterium]|jgi:ACS family tartrate transporter-like MFS transporter|uniref:Major facilitator superfamily MFS_1 n=1 Tax=Methylobacterium radiotolerans (strain ATCC 27329 / DSM 1819 / JCM 2831 / NBRC 15690 / NCIMB 10815 / 0-1) TaxID=426355 RepID=B1M1D6_METRJ|nr:MULTISPECIES: MFS transporter [Methylobacterium]ACB26111.1 major facilitator superfamily MFS_1 [Methylobacterium radiotolerans JCM 2831]KIU30357.1 membrane protein [Methylobacterium radiotolerans]KTS10133.1 membrane protein [Methylobacterium radiotolerans]KTS44354.1 membrane protein [Methylobacterium radiotolerans]KZB99587.1 putative tartrate transporter [Methylobacterium radiotolerans]